MPRYKGSIISATPPTVVGGESGSASGVWALKTHLQYVADAGWPVPVLSRELYVWGEGSSGRLGLNEAGPDYSSPVQVGALTNWNLIDGGYQHMLALKKDGTLWAWGRNFDGQCGQNTQNPPVSISSPVQVGSETDWTSFSCGFEGSFGIRSGELYAWGDGQFGQPGQGDVINRSSPVQVGALTNWSIVNSHTYAVFAIKTEGTLWSWGRDTNGTLGHGTTGISKSSPVQIGALSDWASVSSGEQHCLAVKTDGTLWAWGYNANGQVGDNTVVTRNSPVQIGSLTTWSSVAGGYNYGYAIKTDGTLWSWGNSGYGQLGHNNTIAASSPVQIGALTTWVAAAAGERQGYFLKTDGTLWSVGYGINGQLGDNTALRRSSPVQIGSLTNWAQIGAGYQTGMATTEE